MVSMRPRAVTPADLPVLQEIEVAAGELFRAVGMPEIADDEPFPLDVLEAYRRGGRAWAIGESGRPVAYLLADLVDAHLHIEQVTVHPSHARQGLGRRLIEHLGGGVLTLTTFTEVPWNAPYYRRLGFHDLPVLTPALAAVRRREAAHGLDRWPRTCMIRPTR
jgi:GNAT superfamily N-acetyltransferase